MVTEYFFNFSYLFVWKNGKKNFPTRKNIFPSRTIFFPTWKNNMIIRYGWCGDWLISDNISCKNSSVHMYLLHLPQDSLFLKHSFGMNIAHRKTYVQLKLTRLCRPLHLWDWWKAFCILLLTTTALELIQLHATQCTEVRFASWIYYYGSNKSTGK